jgi:glycosyltransferase involved in cell wall biosynthesis
MIKIVSCFWNIRPYVERFITSIKIQTYNEFEVFLIDDLSTDNTVNTIQELIKDDNRFKLIQNSEKKYKLRNMDELIMDDDLIDDNDIIVELDGDDWFYHENVLKIVNEKYKNNKNLWLTNGSFIYSDGTMGFSSKVNYRTVRKDNFTFSHLRTWKAHLWRNIEEESFLDENGEYFKSAPDVAYSFPMVEMSGDIHYEYISDILVVYNAENQYNEHKPNSAGGGPQTQLSNAQLIRNKTSYKCL